MNTIAAFVLAMLTLLAPPADEAVSGLFNLGGERFELMSRVKGDDATARATCQTLPEWQKQATNAKSDHARMKAARVLEQAVTWHIEKRQELTDSEGGQCRDSGRALIKSSDGDCRHAGIVALGVFGEPKDVKALIAATKDARLENIAAAAVSLGRLGEESAIPSLEALVRNSQPYIRREAIIAIGLIGGKKSRQSLEKIAASSKEPGVAENANRALDKLDGRKP